MDLNLDNEGLMILVIGLFAITCVYWAGRVAYAAQTARAHRRHRFYRSH